MVRSAVTRPARVCPRGPTRPPERWPTFAAIDFETADEGADSACAVAVVRSSGGLLTTTERRRIRPPRSTFRFSSVHGITWERVMAEPSFADVWPQVRSLTAGVDFLAAHNASFDRRIIVACCRAAEVPAPRARFVCTVEVARSVWGIFPTKLPDVCRELRIPLVHHEPLSDATACAEIVLAALRAGWQPPAGS